MQGVSKSHYKTLPRKFANNQRRSSVLSAIVLICIFLFFAALRSESATPAANQKKLQQDLFSVTFPTENDGWACGRWGSVVHTADGGKTWSRQDTGTDYTLSSIHFVDEKNGWAVGDEGIIINTKDGGKTWAKQKSPISYFLMGVHFANVQKGWIVTERTTILHTKDGGKTWVKQFSDLDYILKSVRFCDDKNGWAVGEYGFVYHTDDGGTSWKKQAGEFGISEETGEIVAGNFLFGVFAVNPQTAWAVGIDGYVTRTVDGGRTWSKVNVPVPKVHLYSVVSNKTGAIAIGGDGVFVWSYNGGNTWKSPEFKPPITYGWLYGLVPRGAASFVAVGLDGAIYVSNGSTTLPAWSRVMY
ncbi:MAG: YCF48-related protein [Deltaproteobacteria bacterium]|nr:YCF48-related protein [Deltaproteobacteria bacterium]